jgi:hypothetical protein
LGAPGYKSTIEAQSEDVITAMKEKWGMFSLVIQRQCCSLYQRIMIDEEEESRKL